MTTTPTKQTTDQPEHPFDPPFDSPPSTTIPEHYKRKIPSVYYSEYSFDELLASLPLPLVFPKGDEFPVEHSEKIKEVTNDVNKILEEAKHARYITECRYNEELKSQKLYYQTLIENERLKMIILKMETAEMKRG